MSIRDWLFGSPEQSPAKEALDILSTPAPHDPYTREHLIDAQFVELKALVESLPDLRAECLSGETAFHAIYRPFTGWQPESRTGHNFPPRYGCVLSAEAFHRAACLLPDDERDRVLDGASSYVRIKEAWPEGRYGFGGVPFDYVQVRTVSRPEVYTTARGHGSNHYGDLDYLRTELDRLAVRNRSPDALFKGRPLVLDLKLFAFQTMPGGRSQGMGVGVSLSRVGVTV